MLPADNSLTIEVLARACYSKEVELAKELLDRGALFHFTSELFATAVVKGGPSILALALSRHSVNITFPFVYHTNYRTGTIVDFTLLMLACSEGWSDSCRLLLEAGADPNAQDNSRLATPMHWLATWIRKQRRDDEPYLENSERIIRLLIEHGANPNLQNHEQVSAFKNLTNFYPEFKKLFIGEVDDGPVASRRLKRRRE